MKGRPGARTLSVLLAGALVVAAVLLAEGLRGRGRPTGAASLVVAEPTPGVETGDGIRGSADWFYEQRAYPAAHTPRGALARAVRQAEVLRTHPEPGAPKAPLNWTEVGPKPIGILGGSETQNDAAGMPPYSGRVSAIATDPSNADIVYLGGAAGGVWKSTDGGASWTPKFPTNQGSFAIGAIAVDPSNPQNVWVGTGDGQGGGAYFGMGIYKSTNGGTDWTKLGGTTFDGRFVADLAIVNSSTVVVAVLENGNPELPSPGVFDPACARAQRGVWRTIDGGSSWTKVALPSSSHQAPSDFSQVPGAPSTIYLATFIDGIYKSTDGGASWTKVVNTSGLYRGAISAFNADIVYAAYTDLSTDYLGAAFKSTDGGATWHVAAGNGGTDSPCTYPPRLTLCSATTTSRSRSTRVTRRRSSSGGSGCSSTRTRARRERRSVMDSAALASTPICTQASSTHHIGCGSGMTAGSTAPTTGVRASSISTELLAPARSRSPSSTPGRPARSQQARSSAAPKTTARSSTRPRPGSTGASITAPTAGRPRS